MVEPKKHSVSVEIVLTRTGSEVTGAVASCTPSAGERTVQVGRIEKTDGHEALELATGRAWERTGGGLVCRSATCLAAVTYTDAGLRLIVYSGEYGDILDQAILPSPAHVAERLALWPEFRT